MYIVANAPKRFIGTSSEDKPKPKAFGGELDTDEPLKTGTEFEEIDTERSFVWDGTRWMERKTELQALEGIAELLQTLIAEVQKLQKTGT